MVHVHGPWSMLSGIWSMDGRSFQKCLARVAAELDVFPVLDANRPPPGYCSSLILKKEPSIRPGRIGPDLRKSVLSSEKQGDERGSNELLD
jgi:hypothetical protein